MYALQFSVEDPDPHYMAAWIRIHIPNADPGGLERVRRKGEKNSAKKQIITVGIESRINNNINFGF
jgi:hypothetical protein